MNIIIYFENEINPLKGGTERAAENLALFLKSHNHNIIYLAKFKQNCQTTFLTLYLPNQNLTSRENITFVENLVTHNQIDIIINEGGNTADVNLFNHTTLNVSSKIITCLHFAPKQTFNKYWYADILVNSVHSFLRLIHRALYRKYFLNKLKNNYRTAIEKGDYFIVLSEYYKIEICEMLRLEDSLKEKIKTIPNLNSFTEDLIVDDYKENLAIYVGRISYSTKRIDRILKIWQTIESYDTDWSLEIVGDGPDIELFKSLAQKLDLKKVRFCGQQDSLQYYQRAKLLFLSSNYEGFPMVLLEAMSMKCVPIVFDSFGAAREIIKNGENGFLVKPFKLSDFTRKTWELISSPDKLRIMAINAHRSIKYFSTESIGEKWNDIL